MDRKRAKEILNQCNDILEKNGLESAIIVANYQPAVGREQAVLFNGTEVDLINMGLAACDGTSERLSDTAATLFWSMLGQINAKRRGR